jgi:hypothetical protein
LLFLSECVAIAVIKYIQFNELLYGSSLVLYGLFFNHESLWIGCFVNSTQLQRSTKWKFPSYVVRSQNCIANNDMHSNAFNVSRFYFHTIWSFFWVRFVGFAENFLTMKIPWIRIMLKVYVLGKNLRNEQNAFSNIIAP